MKAKGIVIFLVLMTLLSFIPANLSKVEEQDQEYVASFNNGNEYLEFEEYQKWFYVEGLMDAIYTIFSYLDPEKYQKYVEATKDMTVSQLTKILDKYLEENPEILHCAAADIILFCLGDYYERKGVIIGVIATVIYLWWYMSGGDR